jgi:hypothetical protein
VIERLTLRRGKGGHDRSCEPVNVPVQRRWGGSRCNTRDGIVVATAKEFLDCRNGIWGTEKLHTETNIWRMIAQPDAHGESNQSAARSRMSYDRSASGRRTGTVACTLPAGEACA